MSGYLVLKRKCKLCCKKIKANVTVSYSLKGNQTLTRMCLMKVAYISAAFVDCSLHFLFGNRSGNYLNIP